MSKTKIWCCTKNNVVSKKVFEIEQKVIWYWQKQVDVAQKSVLRQQKK